MGEIVLAHPCDPALQPAGPVALARYGSSRLQYGRAPPEHASRFQAHPSTRPRWWSMPILTSLPRSSPLSRKRIDQGDRNAGTVPTPAPRRLLFISHANPEDNAFATWLATQLAIAGYEVWC